MKPFRHILTGPIRELLGRPRKSQPILFNPTMTIDQAWHAHRGAPAVFAAHHLPACDGCSVRFDERLDEAAEAYGIDIDAFVSQLNALRL